MRNIGLVLFTKEREKHKLNFVRSCLIKIKKAFEKIFSIIFKKSLHESSIRKIEIDANLNIFLMRLPYSLDELIVSRGLKLKGIQKTILRACMENGIEKCILPASIPKTINMNYCIKNPFSGNFIYTALIVYILELISDKKGISIRDLDVAIIHGRNYSILHSYIEFLSPVAKFITIITNEKKSIQDRIEEIFDETGLSVRVTNDIASGMDNADVVINLGDINDFIVDKEIKSDALIINYGNLKGDKFIFNNFVINGINVCLDKRFEGIIDTDVYDYYSKIELAEIILSKKLNIDANIIDNNSDYSIMQKLSKQFVEDGYRITEYIGRRNIVKSGDISLL
ncbi:MAG: hypothetical protein ACOYWZ_22420 [Bacillota bacterium]